MKDDPRRHNPDMRVSNYAKRRGGLTPQPLGLRVHLSQEAAAVRRVDY